MVEHRSRSVEAPIAIPAAEVYVVASINRYSLFLVQSVTLNKFEIALENDLVALNISGEVHTASRQIVIREIRESLTNLLNS